MKTARQAAFDGLFRVLYEGGFSAPVLDGVIGKNRLSPQDAGFCAALFYGVLETAPRLDYLLSRYLKKPPADPEIRLILQMGVYQLLYLASVPDRAAVDESVKLAVYAKKSSARGLVNGVLRAFIRDGKRAALPEGDSLFAQCIHYACPEWILSQWREQYGREAAERMAAASLGRPPLAVRVNRLRISPEALLEEFSKEGVEALPHPLLPDCLLLEGTGSVGELPQYRKGLFHVQDVSAQLAVLALSPRPGERVLDICAAPGSKSFTAAQLMENRGEIAAFDLSPQKAAKIREGAHRLGITILTAGARDGRRYDPAIPPGDRVLCDAPCSGLGVIRRKPEIKYREERRDLPELQYALLTAAGRYVKPGGVLVYSTCTTNREENEEVAKRFLSQNISFKPLQLPEIFSKMKGTGREGPGVTLLPGVSDGDGFYIAAFCKKETIPWILGP